MWVRLPGRRKAGELRHCGVGSRVHRFGDGCVLGPPSHLSREADFKYADYDISAYINVIGDLEDVYHLASHASPVDFERVPSPILEAGALRTHNALGLDLARGPKRCSV
jgi:hypothetical protein